LAEYIADLLTPVAEISARTACTPRLNSRRFYTFEGRKRAFSVAATHASSQLPTQLKLCRSTVLLKRKF